MIIKKLILKGYNRISQNNIDGLEVVFTTPLQIILGSNGSGKSSLIEQLSPLPPASSDFDKGGYKEIHFTFNGKEWIAISNMREKKHFLSCNSEVLNDWGTAQVQKSLIELHLGLTPEIFDVLSTKKKFTEMGPSVRRDWIMQLSKIDLTQAMKIFEDAKIQLRDAKGYMVKLADRIKLEVNNLVDEKAIEEVKKELEELKKEYEYYSSLPSEHHNLNIDDDSFENHYINLIKGYEKAINNRLEVDSELAKEFKVVTPENLDNFIYHATMELANLNKEKESLLEKLVELNKIAEAKKNLDSIDVNKSNERIIALKKGINEAKGKSNGLYSIDNPIEALKEWDEVYADLYSAILDLKPDNNLFSGEFENNCLAKKSELEYKLKDCNTQLANYEHKLSHFENSESINCPKCNHSFKKVGNVTTENVDDLKSFIARLNETKHSIEKEINEVNILLESRTEFRIQISNIANIVRSLRFQKGVTDYIASLSLLIRKEQDKDKILEIYSRHRDEILNAVFIVDLEDELIKEEAILKKAIEDNELVKSNAVADVDLADKKLFEINGKIDKWNEYLFKAENLLSRYQENSEAISKLDNASAKLIDLFLKSLDNDRFNEIKRIKFDILKEINLLETKLTEMNTNNVVYKDMLKEHDKAKQDYEDYKKIVDSLSPNTGVIADIMNNTIDIFVRNLNYVIESVWTSDLKVLPCINKKNDLDWKFPVVVDNGIVRDDIANTSTSQTDIINLAFQLIVANSIGGKDFPLYLDEIGSAMDEQHRINMMHVIGDLVNGHQCSQLFLISHFASLHDQFNNAEFLLLNDKNILNLPSVYNEHVIFS